MAGAAAGRDGLQAGEWRADLKRQDGIHEVGGENEYGGRVMPNFQLREWLRERVEARRARRITLDGARGRAGRGAAYLDEVAPGWADAVDPWSLDLAHGNTCVLGQLHGSFSIGLGRAGLFSLSSAPRASFSPVDLGFHCIQGICEALQEQDYEYLNQAWHEEIERRCARRYYAGENGLPTSHIDLHGDGGMADAELLVST